MGGMSMYRLSPWQEVTEIVVRNLFFRVYQKEDFPRRIEIDLDFKHFERDKFLRSRLIGFCLGIGWETAELIEIEGKKSLSLVLKRTQKRCPSG